MALRLFVETAALRDFDPAYARLGSLADMTAALPLCPLSLKSGHSRARQ
jgi:hypothetical protein